MQLAASLESAVESLVAPLGGFERGGEGLQLRNDLVKRCDQALILLQFPPCRAPFRHAEEKTKIAHGPIEQVAGIGNARLFHGCLAPGNLCIACQLLQLLAAHRETEKLVRHLRKLMCLVDDEGIGHRQQLAEALVPQCKIGTEQVMIDDDEIRLLCSTARLDEVTGIMVGTLLAEAVVGCRGHERPYGSVFRYPREFGDIAMTGLAGPAAHLLEHIGNHRYRGAVVEPGAVHAVDAEIVGTSLEKGCLHTSSGEFPDARKIATEKLVLEVFRSGRDHDLAFRQQRGEQVGESLAGAGPCLADQNPALLECPQDGLCHLLLLGSVAIALDRLFEYATLAEKLCEPLHAGVVSSVPRCRMHSPPRAAAVAAVSDRYPS